MYHVSIETPVKFSSVFLCQNVQMLSRFSRCSFACFVDRSSTTMYRTIDRYGIGAVVEVQAESSKRNRTMNGTYPCMSSIVSDALWINSCLWRVEGLRSRVATRHSRRVASVRGAGARRTEGSGSNVTKRLL